MHEEQDDDGIQAAWIYEEEVMSDQPNRLL